MARRRNINHNNRPIHKPYSGFAIAGFILSFFGLFSVLGIVFSAIALFQTTDGRMRGRGLAIAGLIIGIIVFISSVVVLGSIIAAFAAFGIRNEGGIRTSNNGTVISISGIDQQETINDTKTIELRVSGISNIITVSENTNVSSLKLSGINNQINLCEPERNIPTEKSGIDNSINFIEC